MRALNALNGGGVELKDMTYGQRSRDQLVVKLRLADDHMEIK